MEKSITFGIVGCSNGQNLCNVEQNKKFIQFLEDQGIAVRVSRYLYRDVDGVNPSAQNRAKELMKFYRDDYITDIFDISGGNIANEVLPFLDFDLIGKSRKRFWGYSDLTVILNAVYSQTGKSGVLYQLRNTYLDAAGTRLKMLLDHVNNGDKCLFDFDYEFIQGECLEGIVVGGNIRCFLKLAGTLYFPDLADKVLFLEARSGGVEQITAYLSQLSQMGAFEKVGGILLGTFTEMDEQGLYPLVAKLVKGFVGSNLPVAKTKEIGHSVDSKALAIGKYLKIQK